MKKKLKFHNKFVIREKGVDKVLGPGIVEVEEKSVKRWLKRGCEIAEEKKEEVAKEKPVEEKPVEKEEEAVEEEKPRRGRPSSKK